MGVITYHVSTQDAEWEPRKLVSTSRHARSQCMSESQGRSIRGFDRWDFTNEHVEVS